jgi:hypothetical protein
LKYEAMSAVAASSTNWRARFKSMLALVSRIWSASAPVSACFVCAIPETYQISIRMQTCPIKGLACRFTLKTFGLALVLDIDSFLSIL